MNLVYIISILIAIILICLVYIIVLLNKESKNKKNITETSSNNSRINSSTKVLDLDKLSIPLKIKELDIHTLFQSCVSVYDSFKALDYNKKLERKLDVLEWHNWQVSLLLALMKEHKNVFIPQPNKVFHKLILEMSYEQVESEFRRILLKYENYTDIKKTREDLREQVIWSAREVSIIFYFMTIGTY